MDRQFDVRRLKYDAILSIWVNPDGHPPHWFQVSDGHTGTEWRQVLKDLFSMDTQTIEELGTTRIVIAHRLSTIRKADRIYVLKQGRVVQQGDFATLAGENGHFRDLMAGQLS